MLVLKLARKYKTKSMQDNRKYYIKEKQRRRMNMKRTMFISQTLIFAEREIVNSIKISVSTKKINIESTM